VQAQATQETMAHQAAALLTLSHLQSLSVLLPFQLLLLTQLLLLPLLAVVVQHLCAAAQQQAVRVRELQLVAALPLTLTIALTAAVWRSGRALYA
jgi:ABC-type sulfate transport system permease component